MTAAATLPLASYKLRIADVHVRAMPAIGLDGGPFHGPGVDLRGDDAARALAAAEPVFAWLRAREPGVVIRSISVAIRASGTRVLASLEPLPGPLPSPPSGDARPRAMRFDPPYGDEIREAGRAAEAIIGEACRAALARRPSS